MITTAVYKYPVPADDCIIEMPSGAKVLTARRQHGRVCIWAFVNRSKPAIRRRVRILGTGHDAFLNDFDYVDTFMVDDGVFVFHVFIEREKLEDPENPEDWQQMEAGGPRG